MSEVTRMLTAIERGEARAAEELLPLVYDELRQLAAQKLSEEKPGQTLQPTALVHEAWLRLARQEERQWADRKHFFFAAAVAMRRILVESARRKARLKRGGLMERIEFPETGLPGPAKSEEVLALDEALARFALEEPEAARLVELRFFVGLSHQEAAGVLGISRRVADGLWAYARAWLLAEMRHEPGKTKLPRTSGTTG
ncbi:MAG TPA: ECF-type sigma factor [Candidatus Acidoferrum sp.]|nr:ECF-type sigma factor [Candidatus Acidoferrum sp.]